MTKISLCDLFYGKLANTAHLPISVIALQRICHESYLRNCTVYLGLYDYFYCALTLHANWRRYGDYMHVCEGFWSFDDCTVKNIWVVQRSATVDQSESKVRQVHANYFPNVIARGPSPFSNAQSLDNRPKARYRIDHGVECYFPVDRFLQVEDEILASFIWFLFPCWLER